ncbi:uncharacterized protein LOC142579721 [Dermacentor variabilis]|uniref:uncharacterized protein LOC142579721 n=1 Tax=Dermacentor variabilis TaxID=34621 RepID=UPI003F5C24F7
MADNPNERSVTNEGPSPGALQRHGAATADNPNETAPTEQRGTDRARHHRKRSRPRSRHFGPPSGVSPSSSIRDTMDELTAPREQVSPRTGTLDSRSIAHTSLGPVSHSGKARRPPSSHFTTDWRDNTGTVPSIPVHDASALDDTHDEGGRRSYRTADDSSVRHSRRSSQMDPSQANRSPSRQRPKRTAEHALVPETVTDRTRAGVPFLSSHFTTDWRDSTGTVPSTHAHDASALDDTHDEGGRRPYQTADDSSGRHSRRSSQMDPLHARRSPSRQRPQRIAAHDLVPGTVTDQTVAGGRMGQSTDGIPKGDDAHYAPDLQQWRWPRRASAHSGSPRHAFATRADFPRDDQQTAPHADVWAQSQRSSVGSPSLTNSPERRVTIHPSAKMELARNKQLDGAFQLASAEAEPVAGPQFKGPVPHQVIRWPSVRSADQEAAARRRSVAEQLLMSSPTGPVSPIDHGPLEMAAGITSGRRQSMMVQAAIHDLPKFSEAGAKQKRRASMDYRARALHKREQSPHTRVPSVSPGHYAEQELERHRLDKLQSHLRGCRRHKKRLVFAATSVLLLLVVIYLVLRARTSLEDGVCSSDDCLDHAHQLLQSLDTTADPCTRFHAYVCGANRSRPDAQVAEALPYAKLVASSVVSAATTSAPPAADGRYPATSKALTALSTCLDAPATKTAEHFVRFMEARGIRWPSVDSGGQVGIIGVFDVLFDLIVNWRVVLWFDAKLVYLTEDRLPVVAFEEPGALPLLRMRQMSLLDDVAYGRAVGSVSLFLTNGTTELKNSAIQELHKDEGAIRDAVLSTRTDEHDILLPLHKAHQLYVHNASLNEWRAVITKHVKSTAVVSIETKILIMKQYSFSRLSNLLETISPARLLNVIGWMFAYVYVWMLNADFLSLGGQAAENAGAGTHCFLAVHESFGIVQASTIFQALFDTEARKEYVSTLFNSTSRALLSQLQASESITNLTKKEAALKIGSHMRAQLFPALPFMITEQLDGLYSIFPDNYGKDATFFEMWLKSKQALQLALYSPFHDNLLTARYRWQSGSAIYLYSVNLVWLAVSALLPPSYLTRGSPIMTYSGLGYQFARQLVRIADERGRKLDYTGSEIPWWEQQGKCALDRATTKRDMKEVADLFALDVALAALKSSAASSHEGGLSTLGIKQLEMFSPLQTFYISYCSHFCDDPVEGPVMCNLAVNASDFAEAFGCQRQSPPTCLFA